jgi:hypothetical protein
MINKKEFRSLDDVINHLINFQERRIGRAEKI